MGQKLVGFWLQPSPGQFGLGSLPIDIDRLRRGQHRRARLTDILEPDDLPENAIEHDVLEAIAIPIGNAQGGVTPLGLCRALDATVRSGHHTKNSAVDQKFFGAVPFGECDSRPAEVFEELDGPGGVPRDDVFVSIVIPVDAHGSGKRPALERIGELLKVPWFLENRSLIGRTVAGVSDQGNASVFVADDQVVELVAIPIEGHRDDHLKIHPKGLAVGTWDPNGVFVDGIFAGADVLEISEPVEEFTAEQVQIAVLVPVQDVWRGATEGFERSA